MNFGTAYRVHRLPASDFLYLDALLELLTLGMVFLLLGNVVILGLAVYMF